MECESLDCECLSMVGKLFQDGVCDLQSFFVLLELILGLQEVSQHAVGVGAWLLHVRVIL